MPRKVTKDEGEIRRWAAQHKARPVQKALIAHDSEPAQIGFVFGDFKDTDEIKLLDWSQFFALFHMLGLVLAYDADQNFELLRVEEGPALNA